MGKRVAELTPDQLKHRREYHRNYMRGYAFDITSGEVSEILEDQGAICAICKRPPDCQKNAFHLDHCHDTGFVRGLLCSNCNTGIGKLREDPTIMRAALAYVEKFQRINGLS